MRLSVIASASLALIGLFATPAFAQEATTTTTVDAPQSQPQYEPHRRENGLELGARLGFGLGLGSVFDQEGATMSDNVGSQIPVVVDIGYRINRNFYVGGYGQYGYGIVSDDRCGKNNITCSAQSYRIGINAHYHFMPDAAFDPWIGIGTGYEWLHKNMEQGSNSQAATLSGFEIVNLQVGGDYHLSRHASIGPFAQFALGQYSNAAASVNGQDVPGDTSIQKTALHEWLTFGVKGTFDL